MSPRVSVIVATHNTGPSLERLVQSLDAQSPPGSDVELVVVDNGSTSDVWHRVHGIRDRRPNTTIKRIVRSGSSSRPRNVGLGLSGADYVFFADDDGEVFADGLRAACDFAVLHDLDIVGVEVAGAGAPGHASGAVGRDTHGARAEFGILGLTSATSQVLYRRRLLLDHGIAFDEDAPGGPWAQVDLLVDAYAAATRIGAFAGTSVYRRGDGDDGHADRPGTPAYWRGVHEVFAHAATVLTGDEYAADRAALCTHLYQRVLREVEPVLAEGDDDDLSTALIELERIRDEWLPPGAGDTLPARDRRVHELLTGGEAADRAALRQLARSAGSVVAISSAEAVDWRGGVLTIRVTAVWSAPAGKSAAGLLAATDAAQAAALQREAGLAGCHVVLAARPGGETSSVPTTCTLGSFDPAGPIRTLTVSAAAEVDTHAVVTPGAYDVRCRNTAFGFTHTGGLRFDAPTRVGLVDGDAVIAYRTKRGMLAIDIGQQVRSVINSADCRFDLSQVTRRLDGRIEIVVPLDDVHVHSDTRIGGTVTVTPRPGARRKGRLARVLDVLPALPARSTTHEAALVGDATGARLEMTLRAAPGKHALAFDFGDRLVPSAIELTTSRWARPVVDKR